MIEHEAEPLTDEQIAEGLAAKGITVARRTVAKYREQLGILPPSCANQSLPGGLGRGLPQVREAYSGACLRCTSTT